MTIQPIAHLISHAFTPPDPRPAIESVTTRRRKKLWELPPRWHCPLIGTCFSDGDLRRLAKRTGIEEPDMSDYVLHTRIVAHCDSRTQIAALIQRRLDERFASAIRRFGKAKDPATVLDFWQQAIQEGDVAGALWAAWSHPDIDESEGTAIYGDIHMLAHQASGRKDVVAETMATLEQNNARLRDEMTALRLGISTARIEHARKIAELGQRLADAEQRAAQHARDEAALIAARGFAARNSALEARIATQTGRMAELERENAAHVLRAEASSAELAYVRAELAATAATLEATFALCAADHPTTPDAARDDSIASLAGRSVLCVGGLTRLVDQYRRLVEASGGRFFHHDGGQEESLHRMDAIVAGADIVLCQSAFVSHSAYYRLKDACKRRGLPCVFLKSAGITSFTRSLESVAGERASGPPN